MEERVPGATPRLLSPESALRGLATRAPSPEMYISRGSPRGRGGPVLLLAGLDRRHGKGRDDVRLLLDERPVTGPRREREAHVSEFKGEYRRPLFLSPEVLEGHRDHVQVLDDVGAKDLEAVQGVVLDRALEHCAASSVLELKAKTAALFGSGCCSGVDAFASRKARGRLQQAPRQKEIVFIVVSKGCKELRVRWSRRGRRPNRHRRSRQRRPTRLGC